MALLQNKGTLLVVMLHFHIVWSWKSKSLEAWMRPQDLQRKIKRKMILERPQQCGTVQEQYFNPFSGQILTLILIIDNININYWQILTHITTSYKLRSSVINETNYTQITQGSFNKGFAQIMAWIIRIFIFPIPENFEYTNLFVHRGIYFPVATWIICNFIRAGLL